MAAKEMEHIVRKNYERLWRREDELISQFLPLLPRSGVEPVRSFNKSPYASIEAGPLPLAVIEPMSLLALPTPRVNPQIEKVKNRLGATQLGFQEAMMKQFQSLTDHMFLLIRNQQPGPRPQIESSKHSSGFWCIQCQQPGHTRQFCRNEPNRDQMMNDNAPQQNQRGENQNQNQGNSRGPPSKGQTNQESRRRGFIISTGGIMS